MFNNLFSKAPSPLQNDPQRAELQQAILNNQPDTFREILAKIDPALLNQIRVYGVMIKTPHGISPILVDNTGQPLRPDFMLSPETPMDMLNVRFEDNQIITVIDGEEWRAALDDNSN